MATERSETDEDNTELGVDDPSESAVAETDGEETTDTSSEPTPSAAFQRQQRRVGIAGALLAGGALAVALYQRFPDTSVLLPVVGGVLGTVVVLWFVRKSVFVGDGTVTE